MSTPEVRQKYVRSNRRKKSPLNVDLNVPPQEAIEEMGMQAGNSQQAVVETRAVETHVVEARGASASGNGNGSGSGSGAPANQAPPPTIDLEAIDDEVVISSPRRFNEARKKSRRNQVQNQNVPVANREVAALIERSSRSTPGFADEDITVLSLNAGSTRRRIPSAATVIDLESNYGMGGVRSNEPVLTMHPPAPPPPPPAPAPREPTFNCPVCMGPLVEEMSTKCGHIFCKQCIRAAISVQNKCPTCRRKLNLRDVLRVYLPATS